MLLLLPFTLLFLTRRTLGNDLNVGTVLFTKADLDKECWSSENLALLTSRMILEDLLPSTNILMIDSDEFITDLVEYFRLVLETVRQETQGKTKHITLLALTDLLGGYLHYAVLPIAKYSFYEGLIDYDSMATLLGLFDELKWFLKTNGQGWAEPMPHQPDVGQSQMLPLKACDKDQEICDNLMLVEEESAVEKRSVGGCEASIPLPFFDSLTQPSAVALPTKISPLRSVTANTSSYLLMDFFIEAHKCLEVKKVKVENIDKFHTEFGAWIEEQIMPRLADEKFYTAFGGILRVRNTIRELKMASATHGPETGQISLENGEGGNEVGPVQDHRMSRSSMILMAVLITIFVWFILGTLFICYRMRQSRQNNKDETMDNESGENTTTGTSLCSSKFFYPEKLCTRSAVKGPRHEITIRTCKCQEGENGDTRSVRSTTPSNRTDRLPSITEMSEATTSTPLTNKGDQKTTDGSAPRDLSKLDLSEDESEESGEDTSPY